MYVIHVSNAYEIFMPLRHASLLTQSLMLGSAGAPAVRGVLFDHVPPIRHTAFSPLAGFDLLLSCCVMRPHGLKQPSQMLEA